MINRIAFFNRLKTYNLYQTLNNGHVKGFDALIDYFEQSGYPDKRWLAYVMATVYHEVNKTMQPIEEYGKGKGRAYGRKLKMDRTQYTDPIKLYYGRGLVQVTWYENYEKLSRTAKAKQMRWNFLEEPELLLTLAPSVWATFHGMTNGLFTGKKLSHYFNNEDDDTLSAVDARRIINGMDKAGKIAGYYEAFKKCLS